MNRTHPTMAADLSIISFGPPSLSVDNAVDLGKEKNDPTQMPHRMTWVKIDSAEGRLLAMWKPSWSIDQLAVYLRNNPEVSKPIVKDFSPSNGPIFCNPEGYFPSDPKHASMGNREWTELKNGEYLTADIQDREVKHMILCFWKSNTQGLYYLQYELQQMICRLLQQL